MDISINMDSPAEAAGYQRAVTQTSVEEAESSRASSPAPQQPHSPAPDASSPVDVHVQPRAQDSQQQPGWIRTMQKQMLQMQQLQEQQKESHRLLTEQQEQQRQEFLLQMQQQLQLQREKDKEIEELRERLQESRVEGQSPRATHQSGGSSPLNEALGSLSSPHTGGPQQVCDATASPLSPPSSHGQQDLAVALTTALTSHHLCKRPEAFLRATPKRPAIKFIEEYESYIRKLCPGNPKSLCLHISDFLEHRALHWYKDRIKETPAEDDFPLLREQFLQRFAKVDPELINYQYQTRRQGDMESVSAYTSDMEALLSYSGLNEKGRVNYYISGLRKDIAGLVRPKDPNALEEAESLAREVERNLQAYCGSRATDSRDLINTIREVTAASITQALSGYPNLPDNRAHGQVCAINPQARPPFDQPDYYSGQYFPSHWDPQDDHYDGWQWRPQRGRGSRARRPRGRWWQGVSPSRTRNVHTQRDRPRSGTQNSQIQQQGN